MDPVAYCSKWDRRDWDSLITSAAEPVPEFVYMMKHEEEFCAEARQVPDAEAALLAILGLYPRPRGPEEAESLFSLQPVLSYEFEFLLAAELGEILSQIGGSTPFNADRL